MVKMEPYVKKWYDYLADGKLMGLRCKRCGAVEFPPVPICNECSSTDMEWFEISGEGIMETYSGNTMMDEQFASYGPQITASVRLKEGATFASWLVNVPFAERATVYDKIPCKVKMKIQDRGEISYPVFEIVEE